MSVGDPVSGWASLRVAKGMPWQLGKTIGHLAWFKNWQVPGQFRDLQSLDGFCFTDILIKVNS